MHRFVIVVATVLVACRGGGDASEAPVPGPTEVKTATLGLALKVDVDGAGACAVLAGGGVACWGAGNATPRMVAGVGDAIEVKQSCARRSRGAVMCWGADLVAREIRGSEGALDLARGGPAGPCLVTAARDVACIGDTGELATVAGLADVRALGDLAWNYRCAVKVDGTVACSGELDDLGLAGTETPVTVAVPGIANAVDVVPVEQSRACALDAKGTPMCFGPDATKLPARADQLFAGSCARSGGEVQCRRHAPDDGWRWRTVDLAGPAVDLSCTGPSCCAVLATGAVRCWGANDAGQLGDGVPMTRRPPAKVAGLPPMVAVGASHGVTVARSREGQLWAWGFATQGPRTPLRVLDGVTQFAGGDTFAVAARGRRVVAVLEGDGKIITERMPELPSDPQALAIVDKRTVCALLDDGALRCLRDGDGGPTWQPVAGMTDLVQLAPGPDLCGATKSGGVACLLPGDAGAPAVVRPPVEGVRRFAPPWLELADGIARAALDRIWRVEPRPELRGITAISDGGFAWSAACGLRDALVVCWNEFGTDELGTLGRDPAMPGDARAPAPVHPPLRAISVAAGYAHACAVDTDGAVWCWGDDRDGGLGRGRTIQTTVPTTVVDIGP